MFYISASAVPLLADLVEFGPQHIFELFSSLLRLDGCDLASKRMQTKLEARRRISCSLGHESSA
jgi:hypothetical protein